MSRPRYLLPEKWACDVAGSYLTLRLEQAAHRSGVELIDPDLPLLPPVAWHERADPGAEQRVWLTRPKFLDHGRPILPLTRAFSAPAQILLSTSNDLEKLVPG